MVPTPAGLPVMKGKSIMRPLITFDVLPKLPPALEPLREMVFNLWWTWEPLARRLFRCMDVELWDRTNHNPVRMLQLAKQGRLLELAQDEKFLTELKEVHSRFKEYMARDDTYGRDRPLQDSARPIAYFSAEFGFHESIPNYSGGLGILAGDHCKSASDLDLNFCAVGLLYRHGYFRQQINREGMQEASSLDQNFHHLPIKPVLGADGETLLITIPILDGDVKAKVWELCIGRIALYLLDTDLPENRPEDRLITAELYGGDTEMRIRQEIVLGIGGGRALTAMGLNPALYHMNEGHSAFLSLDRMENLVREKQMDHYSALQVVAASTVFTTHTPVPAGNDQFSREMMERYFGRFAQDMGMSFDELMRLGQHGADPHFSMTVLALRTSRFANGVSKLHGQVSRRLWKEVWPGVPEDEVPITSITNGVHTKTWTSPEFNALYRKYLGEDWTRRVTDPDFWRGVIEIPDEELWSIHQLLKSRLIDFIRRKVRSHRERLGESPEQLRKVNFLLDPEVLTIGFARRFATYKRGTLLFSDMDRLRRLVHHPERPVQFVFAGKAHPRDEGGKKLIQQVYQVTREADLEDRLVFLEDYDTHIARRLSQGVDLWLNNPLRPLEASGTSGMKLPPNGGLNFSVLDGWWKESWNKRNGWAIGAEIEGGSVEFQNEVDTASLFHVLENQIIPLYYAKPDGHLPLAWLQLMRESIRSVTPVFSTHRMVREYNELLYEPAAQRHTDLLQEDGGNAVKLSEWKRRIRKAWPQVEIRELIMEERTSGEILVGEDVVVEAEVFLGEVSPEEVCVETYVGQLSDSTILDAKPYPMDRIDSAGENGVYRYRGVVPTPESGAYGVNARVIPTHKFLTQKHELRLITWADPRIQIGD